jgi:hypothetical protein
MINADRIDIALTDNPVYSAAMPPWMALTSMVNSFEFSSTAQGGFATADVTLKCSRLLAFQLMQAGLGKRMTFRSPRVPDSSLIAWEGMVTTIHVDDGAAGISRTLLNTYNRLEVVYATVDTTTTPPTVGAQARTAQSDSAANQALYGIRHWVYPIGGSNSTNATALRDSLLTQYARERATADSHKRGQNADTIEGVSVTLSATGFIETLDKRIWRTTAATSAVTLDTLIKAILTGVGQHIDTDQSNIAANTYTKSQYFDQDVSARRVIDLLCALGDGATGRRSYFQIWTDRKPWYFVAYHARRLDAREVIIDATTGAIVPPYLIRPGKIIKWVDFIPDALTYSSALDDLRTMLIGEVRFTAPNMIELRPVIKDPSELTLARMGLTEIG